MLTALTIEKGMIPVNRSGGVMESLKLRMNIELALGLIHW